MLKNQKKWLIGVVLLFSLISLFQGKRIVYSLLGYHYVSGFDDAHALATRIIQNNLNADECLKIKYTPGRLLPDYLTSKVFQADCLEDVAQATNDLDVCTKMPSYYRATLCGSHLYGGQFHRLESENDLDDHNCFLNRNTEQLTCYFSDGRDTSLTETFSINECHKFSKSQYQDRCHWHHVNTVADCAAFQYEYLRERCYFFYDSTCTMSSNSMLRKACETYKVINERFKDEEYRRSGNFL